MFGLFVLAATTEVGAAAFVFGVEAVTTMVGAELFILGLDAAGGAAAGSIATDETTWTGRLKKRKMSRAMLWGAGSTFQDTWHDIWVLIFF